MDQDKMSKTTTTTTSNTVSQEYWSLPSADVCKAFLKDRTANIFWRFKHGVFGALAQRQYNPVSMTLKYELTADEEKRIKDGFSKEGFDVKVTKNEVDTELDYKTKLDIYLN